MGTVTIDTNEWDRLRDEGRAKDLKLVELEKLYKSAVADADPSKLCHRLNRLVRDCLTVVRFGVENMPPETVKRWPFASLTEIANDLRLLPDHTVDDDSLAQELRTFVGEILEVERMRAARDGMPKVDLHHG